MKKKKSEIQRIESMIKNDRYNVKDDFSELLTDDLAKLLGDYFDFKHVPSIEMIKTPNGITVNIKLSANGIRAFSSVPK